MSNQPQPQPQPRPLAFALTVRPDRERLVVEPRGELDLATADVLRGALADALDDGWAEVVVDLRRLTFLDSQGVHALLDARATYEQSASRMTIVDGVPAVARVLEITGVRTAFVAARGPVPH